MEAEMKSKLKCKTPAKAQVNFRKAQRTSMNRRERREWRWLKSPSCHNSRYEISFSTHG